MMAISKSRAVVGQYGSVGGRFDAALFARASNFSLSPLMEKSGGSSEK
jgi:hypothetical protein